MPNPQINPKTSLLSDASPLIIPAESSGVEVKNWGAGDITVTFKALKNYYVIKSGEVMSLGVDIQFCEMTVTCSAGTTGQACWL